MQPINRKIQPAVTNIEKVSLFEPEKVILDNKIPLFIVNSGTQDLIKIEIVIRAGSWFEQVPLTSRFTFKMLKEGSVNHSGDEIAEAVDFHGAHLNISTGHDSCSISLYALNKSLALMLPLLEDIVMNPVFPEEEFNTLRQNQYQKYLVRKQKVKHIARNRFNELIYGSVHPYGKSMKDADFSEIGVDHLRAFHSEMFSPERIMIIASGRIPDDLPGSVNKRFGRHSEKNLTGPDKTGFEIIPAAPGKYHAEKEGAMQSAIRMGRLLFNKRHPDFFRFRVLNTILGGYFGSRLMTSIREEKGYTYGIGSGVVSKYHSGYFFIASEVGSEVTAPATEAIREEMNKLTQEPVGREELELVRNYLMGSFQRSIDGPFAIGEAVKMLAEYGLDNSYYEKYLETVTHITPEEILQTAQKYIDPSTITELVAGPSF